LIFCSWITQDCPSSAVKEDFFFRKKILIGLFCRWLKIHCSNNYILNFNHSRWELYSNQKSNLLFFSSCHHLSIGVLNACMSSSTRIRHHNCSHFLFLLKDFEFDIDYHFIYLFRFLSFSLCLIKVSLRFKAIYWAQKFCLNCLIRDL
jgi:hypothetical protein